MDREKERPRGEGYTTGKQTVCPTREDRDQGQACPRTSQDTLGHCAPTQVAAGLCLGLVLGDSLSHSEVWLHLPLNAQVKISL